MVCLYKGRAVHIPNLGFCASTDRIVVLDRAVQNTNGKALAYTNQNNLLRLIIDKNQRLVNLGEYLEDDSYLSSFNKLHLLVQDVCSNYSTAGSTHLLGVDAIDYIQVSSAWLIKAILDGSFNPQNLTYAKWNGGLKCIKTCIVFQLSSASGDRQFILNVFPTNVCITNNWPEMSIVSKSGKILASA